MDFLANINLGGLGEIQNANIQNLAVAPTTNLKAGRMYFNTADHTLYVYDGTKWVDALSQGIIYSEGSGIDITSSTISVDIASGANAGNVTLTADSNGLAANAPTASTSTAGLIEIATDTEVSTGTSETLAVNPKQLAGKVDKLSTKPTAGTYPKVTINAEGQVTAGASLEASDIPNLTLSKITDVTATKDEVNVLDGITASTAELNIMDGVTATTAELNTLDGITASTAELNIMDGVTVTASDINSVTSKIALTDLSVDSGSSNYLGYDNTTGKISAKVDTTVTASSSKLVTSGAVDTAISNALVGGVIYKGTWTATSQTDYSSITLPVKKGYLYLVEGSATIGGIEWNAGDYLMVNSNVAAGGTLTDVSKIDNTEAADIVRLNATQTLTNKTIDADDNTISDLTTSNLKSGVLQTTVRAVSSASDTALASEKAIATAINGISKVYTTTNPALTASSGLCTWTVTHNLGSNVAVHVYNATSGDEVGCDKTLTSSTAATVSLLAASNIAAGTYKVVVIGG